MEDAPLPTTMTPKEIISESFEIKQNEINYKLNIQIIDQDIILNLSEKSELMKEYENKLTLEELKQMHRLFLALNSCQEFVDYLKALIENKKIAIKNNTDNQMFIELEVEYLIKKNIIKIDLFKKKINFELIAQDLYTKFSSLTEKFKKLEINYQNIVQENNKIKEENKNIKKEVEILIKDNKSMKEENKSIKKDIELLKVENKNLKEESINIKKEIKVLKEKNKIEEKRNKNLEDNSNLQKNIILKNKEIKNEENGLIMNEKSDDWINIINKNEDLGNNLDKTLEKIDQSNNYQLGKIPNEIKEKENEEVRKEEEKKPTKKDGIISLKEDENKIIEYKGKNSIELLESKLVNILVDQRPTIDINEMNELKKISSTIIIKGGGPLEMINKFFDENFNKSYYEMDQKIKDNLAYKKCLIFTGLQELSLLKKIETKDIEQYMKEFREKFGITEKDYSDKDLKKLVSKKNYEDKTIITEILKKLKYIK